MRALLDARAFIWWVLDMPNLSDTCRGIVSDGENEIVVSVASAYEIAYRAEQGRLTLPETPEAYVRDRLAANGFASMPIELGHALRAATLPRIHGDPFDRLSAAQALIEGATVITSDAAMQGFEPLSTLW